MVNTTCPRCGGYFDSMVQEMCDTCLADELATLHTTIKAKDAEIARLHATGTGVSIETYGEAVQRADAAEARVKVLEEERRLYLGDEMPTRIAALEERYELLQTKYQLDVVKLQEMLADWQERAHRAEAELAEAKKDSARLDTIKDAVQEHFRSNVEVHPWRGGGRNSCACPVCEVAADTWLPTELRRESQFVRDAVLRIHADRAAIDDAREE